MRFSTGLMIVTGALMAITIGPCSVLAAGYLLLLGLDSKSGGYGFLYMLWIPAVFFLFALLGSWLFRRGRAQARAEAQD
jgi:hypothetical protein